MRKEKEIHTPKYANCNCGFVGIIDYYNAYGYKEKWVIERVEATYDVLECPKCKKKKVVSAT